MPTNPQLIATIIQQAGYGISLLLSHFSGPKTLPPIARPQVSASIIETKISEPPPSVAAEKPQSESIPVRGVPTEETIRYQKRELGKELLLLQKHLEQGCKINGVACDCCEKHPIAIEGLAQETLGITGDKIYDDVAEWAKKISPLTSPEASASGQFNEAYPKLAVEARELRKRVTGTTNISALLDDGEKAKVIQTIKQTAAGADK